MATTYELIASNTVSQANVSSIVFNPITQSYNDLIIISSTRNSSNDVQDFVCYVNGSAGTGSRQILAWYNNAPSGYSDSNYPSVGVAQGSAATSGYWSTTKSHIANYSQSSYGKNSLTDSMAIDTTNTYTYLLAGAMNNNITAAVTSLTFYAPSSSNTFAIGSKIDI